MNRIPITQTPDHAISITIALDRHQPIIGPAPHSLGYIVDIALHKARNALTVISWLMGLVAVLAVASPSFERPGRGHIGPHPLRITLTGARMYGAK